MNLRRAAAASAIALPIIAILGFGLTRDPGEIRSPLPGRMAPDFELPVFAIGEGPLALGTQDTIRLSELRGNVVVLNFWASWCLECRFEHAALSNVAEEYEGRDVRFLGVLYNDSPDLGTRWIRDMGGQRYPSVNDPRKRAAIDYGLYGAPETFFVSKEGIIAYKHVGRVTEGVLRQKIDSLLAVTPQ